MNYRIFGPSPCILPYITFVLYYCIWKDNKKLTNVPGYEAPEKKIYVGDDVPKHLRDNLKSDADKIFKDYIKYPKAMIFKSEDKKKFWAADTCHICSKELIRVQHHCHNVNETAATCEICKRNVELHDIVRDHCHFTGQFRGAAHNKCNLDYGIDPRRWKLPIMFHNLRGYDGHLIIKAVDESYGDVRVIPTNMEKLTAFSMGRMQFLDSLQFTMKSLNDLVSTLDDEDFKYTRQVFDTDKKVYLMRKKGVFPYDYLDDIPKFTSNEKIDFPSSNLL